MRRFSVVVFSALVLCATSWSQETTPLHLPDATSHPTMARRPDAKWLRSNWGLPIMYAGLFADWHSSRVFQNRGGLYEANWLVGSDGRFSDARYWAINGALAAALTLIQKVAPPRTKRFLNPIAAAAGGVHLGAAVHNYRLAASP
jgi:hypothetical protein